MSETPAPVAFIAGSTGYVGQAVVSALRSRGVTTIAHIRPGSAKLERLKPAFQAQGATVDTTEWDALALGATFTEQHVTHVFCLIGTTRKQARAEGLEGDIYERIDLGLTRLLVDAGLASHPAPRIVYLSSIGAKVDAGSQYLQARGKAEAAVIGSGLDYAIARPSFITGADRDESRPAERLTASVVDGALAVAGLLGGQKLKARYESTTASELATRLVEVGLGTERGIFEGAHLGRI